LGWRRGDKKATGKNSNNLLKGVQKVLSEDTAGKGGLKLFERGGGKVGGTEALKDWGKPIFTAAGRNKLLQGS